MLSHLSGLTMHSLDSTWKNRSSSGRERNREGEGERGQGRERKNRKIWTTERAVKQNPKGNSDAKHEV